MRPAERSDRARGLLRAAALPAVRWKRLNLERLKRENPAKHAEQRALLEAVIGRPR